MSIKISRREHETYSRCLGACHTCLWEGGCILEEKLKKATCAQCNGNLTLMGKLGQKTWFRCRQCGIDQTA